MPSPKSFTATTPTDFGFQLLAAALSSANPYKSKTFCSDAMFVEGHKCCTSPKCAVRMTCCVQCASSKVNYSLLPFRYSSEAPNKVECKAGTDVVGTRGVFLPIYTNNNIHEAAGEVFKQHPTWSLKQILAELKRSCWVYEDSRATFADTVYAGIETVKGEMTSSFGSTFEGGVVDHPNAKKAIIGEDALVETAQVTSVGLPTFEGGVVDHHHDAKKATIAEDAFVEAAKATSTAESARDTANTALAKSIATSTEVAEIKEMVLSLAVNTTATSTAAGHGGKLYPVTSSSSSNTKRTRLALEAVIHTPSVKGTPSSSPVASPASSNGRARKRLAFNFSEPEEDSAEVAVAAYQVVSILNKHITHVFADVDPSTIGRQDYGIFLPMDRSFVKAMDDELEGLPCAVQAVYRACKIDANKHSELYSSGMVSVPHFVTASTADFGTLNPKPEHNCFITIRSKTGRLVENLVGTNLQAGKEVIFKRFTEFKVISMGLHHFRGRGDVCAIVWEEM